MGPVILWRDRLKNPSMICTLSQICRSLTTMGVTSLQLQVISINYTVFYKFIIIYNIAYCRLKRIPIDFIKSLLWVEWVSQVICGLGTENEEWVFFTTIWLEPTHCLLSPSQSGWKSYFTFKGYHLGAGADVDLPAERYVGYYGNCFKGE